MLLRTRFYLPPLREQAVFRGSLIHTLDAAAGGSLIVVSAPAGYGKTTLISQWLHVHPHTFAWLTLDHEHNHATGFWQYVITALHQVQPEISHAAIEHLLQHADDDITPVLVALLNDLDRLSIDNRSRDPMTLVWDDFHLIKDTAILRQCNLLLDHLPSSLRIVVTTRESPALALPRRRTNGQLIHLDIEQLRFNAHESIDFFQRTMALPITPDISAALCEKTEGWIAGLQLAALSLQRKPEDINSLLADTAIDRHIADYLLEEVFAGLSHELQDFLLQAALPKRFCAGLMNAMLNSGGAQDTLLILDRQHLFLVALDNHRTWFRFHDLFRQFLLQRLNSAAGIDIVRTALRAMRWLENNGYLDNAIEIGIDFQRFSPSLPRDTSPENPGQNSGAPNPLLPETRRLLQLYQQLDQSPETQARAALWESLLPTNPRIQSASVFPDNATHANPGNKVDPLGDTIEPLTLQEKRVFDLIAQGLSNKAIADKLHISVNTLKVHIRNLYGKMGVETRTEALLKSKPQR